MKLRTHAFLSEKNISHDSEVFDYIRELHEYLWRVVRIVNPGASGELHNLIDDAITKLARPEEAVPSLPMPTNSEILLAMGEMSAEGMRTAKAVLGWYIRKHSKPQSLDVKDAPVHTDHPLRHYDRTCPACNAASRTRARKPATPARAAAVRASPQVTLNATVTTTAVPPLAKGEVYAGILLKENGTPSHHLVLLPGEAADVTWQDAKAFAAKAGGELPTRKEQALLFANASQHFKPRWYWSGEEYAGFAEFAWGQYFSYGSQNYWHKSSKTRARAVRRVPI